MDFDPALKFFDWDIEDCPVEIDFTKCASANYQALSLVVLYCLHLKRRRCEVSFKFEEDHDQGASKMWRMMGAQGLFAISTDISQNFKSSGVKPMFAIRNMVDFKLGLEKASDYVKPFGVESEKTLRYLLAELLYNTLEHGRREFQWRHQSFVSPSILQFSWYEQANEIQFLVADTGIGVRSHLSQAYPAIASDDEALRLAIQPEISGTFAGQNPYENRNNAGMGLFLSSSIVRRLKSDMYLVSGDSVLHVSPSDLTSRQLANSWPGTFALVSIRLDQTYQFALDQMMQQFREQARAEVQSRGSAFSDERHYLNVYNYFGTNAEDKQAAIRYRDNHLLLAIDQGKTIVIDFEGVATSPHSFLNALLATPIRRMGIQSYKRIRVVSAVPSIRETIDYVLDDNTSPTGAESEKYEPESG